MKKLLAALFLMVCSAVPARAQLTITPDPFGNVVAPIDGNGWHNFKLTLTRNIPVFQFQGIPTPAQGQITLIVTQDAIGGRTINFVPWTAPTGQVINIVNPCVISLTAAATTLCQFNFDGTTSTWNGLTAPGAPIVSQITVPFSATPTFTYSPGSFWTYFNITLTGNVTSSTLSGGQQNSQVCYFITQDGAGAHTFAYPPTVLNPPAVSSAPNSTTTSCYINIDVTHWQNLSFAASSVAVAGNQGDVQLKNGGSLGSGSLNDNGAGFVTNNGILLQKQNLFACGTNPWYDVSCFGARQPGIITTTCTNPDSTHINVGVTTFVNGDGIVCIGGGATVAPATPSAPTLTSGETESGTQSTAPMTTGLTGPATYSYRIFGVTPNRGVTAASPVVSTTTGPTTLGQQSITLSSATLLGSTESFVTSVAHGLQTNAAIHITAGSNSNQLSGWFSTQVDSATTGHIPNVNVQFNAGGVSTASGHLVYFIGNQLTFTAAAGIEYYGICASRPADSGAFHIIGFTPLAIPGFSTTAETFDDFGAVLSSNPPTPWFLSDANCTAASSTPELYTGTVIAGGTTTSLTVSPALQNNISGTTGHHDNSPVILAAANAAAGKTFVNLSNVSGGYQLWFPLTLPAGVNVVQSGNITTNDYIHQQPFGTGGSGSVWTGGYNIGTIGCPAFATTCGPQITGTGPVTFWNDGSSLQNVVVLYVPNAIGLFSDINCHGNACLYDKVDVSITGTAANDKWGIPIYSRGGEMVMENGLISSGENATIDESWTPAFFLTDYNNGVQQAVGEITLRAMHGNRRGLLWIQSGGTAFQLHVDHYRRQGGITPLFWLQNTNGAVQSTVDIHHPFGDTESQAHLVMMGTNGATFNGPVEMSMDVQTNTDGGGDPPNISGNMGQGAGLFPTFYVGGLDTGVGIGFGWNVANGNLNASNAIVVPGSTNSGSSSVAGNESVQGTDSVGTLSAGNSYQLISTGSAFPQAVFYTAAHSGTTSVTTTATPIQAGHAIALAIFVGNTTTSISSVTDTLLTNFVAEGSQSLAGAGGGTMFWYFGCVPSGGNDAVTITAANLPVDVALWNVTGANCSTPVDTTKFSLATTATPSVATITTANANELVLAFVRNNSIVTATPGSGYTLDLSSSTGFGGAAYQMEHQEFPAVSSTTTAPFTLSASANSAEAAIALIGQIPQVGSPLDPWLNGFFTNFTATAYNTTTNCNVNGASPAACGSAAAGAVVVPTTTTTYTVNTTAVTTNSRIFIETITDATGLSGGPTCNAPPTPFIGYVSARVAATSFTFTLPSTTGTSCWVYHIID